MYRFIQGQSQTYPVQVPCQTLEVSRSSYYEWLKPVTTPTPTGVDAQPTEVEKASNTQPIKDLFSLHRRRYGTRRLVEEMKERGIGVGRDFVRAIQTQHLKRCTRMRGGHSRVVATG